MRLHALEESASARLGLPLVLARADRGAQPSLSESESLCLSAIKRERRKRDWLLGRDALKQVLAALSRDEDTSAIVFPNSQLSLTHSHGISLAVGAAISATGIGIDYEPLREINRKVARFFLSEGEVAWLAQQPECDRNAELLRLWTIKEAAFKCCPANAGMMLNDLTVVDMDAAETEVTINGNASRIALACYVYESGWLSVAALQEKGGA
jgi:4'-phosphopantetheinyl transferase EntD